MALAALSYLMVPALYAAHVGLADNDAPAHHAADLAAQHDVGDGHGDSHPSSPHHDESHCSICHLLGAVGHSGDLPAHAALPVTSAAVQATAFAPRAFRLPGDPQSKPASPRAPPAC